MKLGFALSIIHRPGPDAGVEHDVATFSVKNTDASTFEVVIHSSAQMSSGAVSQVCVCVFYCVHAEEQLFDVMSTTVAEFASSLLRENALKST